MAKKKNVYLVTDIDYDKDGARVKLPKELSINVPDDLRTYDEIEQYISDEISNITGFCHKGFCTTPEIIDLD